MTRSRAIIVLSGVAALAAIAWWGWRRPPSGLATGTPPFSSAPPPAVRPEALGVLEETLRALQRESNLPERQAALEALRQSLLALPPEEAAKQVTAFLDGKEDFATGLEFRIARDHSLAEWPSFRVFLLDVLRSIDPAAAADYGRALLKTPTTADEWALALRNIGSGPGTEADSALLKAKMGELLANEAWAAAPSAGYLEAFDVIVQTRDLERTSDLLSRCADQDRKAVRHASFLTLDRLVQVEPAAMLERLAASASAYPGNGLMLSNMMARADVRDEIQRRAVETWLLDAARGPAEVQAFCGIFPNANYMVSSNLLTPSFSEPDAGRLEKDRAALEAIIGWLNDPRFTNLHSHLERAAERLRGFVK